MHRSTDRILTTHTGSLPRPPALVDILYEKDDGHAVNESVFENLVRDGVKHVVDAQLDAGVDIVNDGEAGKIAYFSYVAERLSGFEGSAPPPPQMPKDLADFPGFNSFVSPSAQTKTKEQPRRISRPVCVGPISFKDRPAVERDILNLKSAAEGSAASELFLSSASPGLITLFLQNEHYKSEEEYLFALADAMREEYEAIANAGLLLQLDCPDLAMQYNARLHHLGVDGFRKKISANIEALNHATQNIPPDRMRMHLCWGNYEGPHHHDIPLKDIIDLIFTARPNAFSFEAANPRHQHEFVIWDDIKLPEGKLVMPGVIDSTTNYIEHPELVAQRIVNFAERVGRENVIPGSDCGFGTGAGLGAVHTEIVWAKLGSLAEGARLATETLW